MTDQATTRVHSARAKPSRTRTGWTRRATGAVAALAMGVGLVGAAQAACTQGIESGTLAKSVRTLQSDLMVAALSCNERAMYNAFAVGYRSDLQQHGRALKSHFTNNYGGTGVKKLNAYVTELANDASIRHAQTGSAYCTAAASVLEELMADGAKVDLGLYALRYAIAVRPQLAQEIASAAGGQAGCDELIALNLPATD
ncbi:MAG: hypothetical protein RIB45_02845 [Marivibrio sp.]|uniref:hypothetical protein n=1 Tax=Marivibrio sp. TaxID=2039719 RepID=UPI0032F02259